LESWVFWVQSGVFDRPANTTTPIRTYVASSAVRGVEQVSQDFGARIPSRRCVPLTDARARNAKPAAKPYKVFDGRGLYLLVTPAGGRLWRFKYRIRGREKLLALGVYPDVSLAVARDARDDARRLLASGTDPSESRRLQAQAITELLKTSHASGSTSSGRSGVRATIEPSARDWSITYFLSSEGFLLLRLRFRYRNE
jgi:hypothetical protein